MTGRLLIAVAAMCALGGAAVSSGSGADGEAPRVERTVRKALRVALVDKDYRRACRFGTPAGRRRLLEGYNSSSGPDYRNCAAIIRDEVESEANRFWIRRLRDEAVVTVLWVKGDRARVRIAEADAEDAGRGHVLMRKLDGRWRFANSDLIPYGD